jgi:hypothetical protein
MWSRTLLAFVAGALALPVGAHASINNGDFETGTVSGWTVAGSAAAKTSAIGVTPPAGTYMGYIETTGNFTALAPAVIGSLGVPGSQISAFGTGAPTNGTGMSQSVTVAAGDQLTFDWNFVTDELNEDPIYNDFAFFTISGSAYLLASRNGSTYDTASPPPGFDGQTDWAIQTYTFPAAGTYTVGFGVFNVGDAGHNSALLLDSIAVPEPATVALLPLGIIALLRRRRTNQG